MMHISDLHLGKRLKDRSLIEDQRFILNQILDIADSEDIEGMLIAGDIFDDGNNTIIEAVELLDWFFVQLKDRRIETFVVSGNHDSMVRLQYGAALFSSNGINIASTFKGAPEKYEMKGRDGIAVDVYLLPFVKPMNVRQFYEDVTRDYDEAIVKVMNDVNVDNTRKNIIVTHQNIVSGDIMPIVSDSERKFIGGEAAVSADNFDMFDYVALGHIHKAQFVGKETVRYSGAILKYALSEKETDKSVTILEIGDDITIREVPLRPLRDVRILSGSLNELIEKGKTDPNNKDYIMAKIDGEEINAMNKIRAVYPNTLALSFNRYSSGDVEYESEGDLDSIDLKEEFERFFAKATGKEMTENQRKIMAELFEKAEVTL